MAANLSDLPPGTPIAIRLFNNQVGYWVRGYEIFDPNLRVSNRDGLTPLTPKAVARGHQCFIVRSGRPARPLAEDRINIRLITPDLKTVEFSEVFMTWATQKKKEKVSNGRKNKKRQG
jgi:hypothetical protein